MADFSWDSSFTTVILLLFLLISIQTPYAWENNPLVHISQSLATIGNLTNSWVYHQCTPDYSLNSEAPLPYLQYYWYHCTMSCAEFIYSPIISVHLLKSIAPFPCLINKPWQIAQQFLRNICSKRIMQLPRNIISSFQTSTFTSLCKNKTYYHENPRFFRD